MGDSYLRRLLVVGATSVVRRANTNTSTTGTWVRCLLERKATRLATVAVANKTARTVWAVLAPNEIYRAPMAAKASPNCGDIPSLRKAVRAKVSDDNQD